MPLLKGALHVHTTLSDGKLTPEEAAAVYKRLGFDFIAITDHDYLIRPGAIEALPAEHAGVLILPGVELTVYERGYVHLNRIRGATEVLHVFNHRRYNLPLDGLIALVAAVARRHPIDAVEITGRGFYTGVRRPAHPYPKVASDDSHHAGPAAARGSGSTATATPTPSSAPSKPGGRFQGLPDTGGDDEPDSLCVLGDRRCRARLLVRGRR